MGSRQCSKCGKRVPDSMKACSNCGQQTVVASKDPSIRAEQEKKGLIPGSADSQACKKCDKPMPANSHKCPHCGEWAAGRIPHAGNSYPVDTLEKCFTCEGKISSAAYACPHCGQPTAGEKLYKRAVIFAAIFISISLVLINIISIFVINAISKT